MDECSWKRGSIKSRGMRSPTQAVGCRSVWLEQRGKEEGLSADSYSAICVVPGTGSGALTMSSQHPEHGK